jgi:hypothetical protein
MGVVEGLLLAATAVTAAGQILGGIQAKQTADYNEAVAKQEAEFQKKRTTQQLAFQRQEVERIIGKAKVVGGGSGIAGGTGISETILKETLTEAEIDRQLIRTQGSINVWRARTQARLSSQEGDYYRTAGFINAGSTILGGLSRYDYRKKR